MNPLSTKCDCIEPDAPCWFCRFNANLIKIEEENLRFRKALEKIATPGQYSVDDFPDVPMTWATRFDCYRCSGFAPSAESLDRNHTEACPIRIAKAALKGDNK
jgi:hypothetical protein